MSPVDQAALTATVTRFVAAVDEIYGIYLDATQGFKSIAQAMAQGHVSDIAGGASASELDRRPFYIGKRAPTDPTNVIFHQTTQGEFKERNTAPEGRNHVRMSQYLIVLVYTVWEVEHRKNIAAALGFASEKELTIPLLGDLRLLRHDIVHRAGQTSKRTIEAAEAVGGFIEDMPVAMDADGVNDLVVALRRAMDELVLTHTGVDPLQRTVWHIR